MGKYFFLNKSKFIMKILLLDWLPSALMLKSVSKFGDP